MSDTPPAVPEIVAPSQADLVTLDIVAFQLYAKTAPEGARESWQADAEIRRNFRAYANDLIGSLGACGIDVVLRRQKQADKFITMLTTIPAKKAYEAGQD